MQRSIRVFLLLASIVAILATLRFTLFKPKSTEVPHLAAMSDLEQLAAIVRPGVVRAVIEIPAGTSDKRQYDHASGTFPVDRRQGEPRRIRFLPYPANYGFIPGTRMDRAQGGDGDALDVFVLCSALPTGTLLEVVPIGIIDLLDANERDDKLIALPLDTALRTIDVADIEELPQAARDILVTWLVSYDPEDHAQFVGIRGRDAAWEEVRRWTVPSEGRPTP